MNCPANTDDALLNKLHAIAFRLDMETCRAKDREQLALLVDARAAIFAAVNVISGTAFRHTCR